MADVKWKVYMHTCPNGKTYVGITSRSCEERWRNGFGYRNNKHFYSAIVKYGWDNIVHEILLDGLTKEEAQRAEANWIATCHSDDPMYGYNHSKGGEGKTGFVPTMETRAKIRRKLIGTHRPEDVKLKLSVAHSGKHLTEEHKLKIRASCKNINSKKVVCETTGIVYDSATDASRKTGVSRSGITACCRGETPSCRKFVWKYAGDGQFELVPLEGGVKNGE